MVRKIGTNAANTMQGSVLADQLFGLGGNDILNGFAGNDLLDGGTGADRMTGGNGNDVYVVDNAGDRTIEVANQGIDTVRSSVSFTAGANVEKLTLTGSAAINGKLSSGVSDTGFNLTGNVAANTLTGGLGHDILVGGRGSDTLNGGEGNDTLLPGAGSGVADIINGGNGFDTVDYRDADEGILAALDTGQYAFGALGDVITLVESVAGSRFADTLRASTAQAASAFGGAGDDWIGGSGAVYDRLRGDDGYDILSGGGNEEDFWLQYDRGVDTVLGFRAAGADHIVIVGSEFNLATTPGNFLSASELGIGFRSIPLFSGAERLVYIAETRTLWADKDGSGNAFTPVPIAIFDNTSAAPTAADIVVF